MELSINPGLVNSLLRRETRRSILKAKRKFLNALPARRRVIWNRVDGLGYLYGHLLTDRAGYMSVKVRVNWNTISGSVWVGPEKVGTARTKSAAARAIRNSRF